MTSVNPVPEGTIVGIHRNDETGVILHSVCPAGDYEYWVDSGETREAALAIIQRMGLNHKPYLDKDTVRP